MPTTTYDELRAAGASEQAARQAAEQLADYRRRLAEMEDDVARLRADLGAVRDTATTRTWVLSVMLLQTAALLGGVGALLRLVHWW